MTSLSTTPAFVINTTYRLHPDDGETFKDLAARLARAAMNFAGSTFFNVGQDVLDPATFHLTEGWQSREVFEAALVGAEFQDILGAALKLRIVERFGDKIFVSAMEKLEMPT